MFTPKNEQGVIVLFAQGCHRFDMEIISIGTEYPDAIIRWKGQELSVEFEYQSSNFYKHQHDPRQCDVIVCWNDDYAGVIPVIAIKYDSWLIDDDFRLATNPEKEAEYWRIKSQRLERELSLTRAQLNEVIASDDEPSDWRLIDDKTKRKFADMTSREIVAAYGISERTARLWHNRSVELVAGD